MVRRRAILPSDFIWVLCHKKTGWASVRMRVRVCVSVRVCECVSVCVCE